MKGQAPDRNCNALKPQNARSAAGLRHIMPYHSTLYLELPLLSLFRSQGYLLCLSWVCTSFSVSAINPRKRMLLQFRGFGVFAIQSLGFPIAIHPSRPNLPYEPSMPDHEVRPDAAELCVCAHIRDHLYLSSRYRCMAP